MSDVRVRFAPSPTGYLHVGGARTAIFNWLYARATGGTFLLRIEDTDPVRSRGELAQVILDGLKWLGIESDEPVVYQSDRKDRFVEVAHELVKRGRAYYDFTTPEELEELRRQSQARKEPAFRFRADLEHALAAAPARRAKGEPYAVRFSAPREGLGWDDLVHGPIHFEGAELEDFVLLRSDGSPTYHLSVVCDDADMRVSHVLRGDDHISNTPKQIGIYRAMGWPVPRFGHVPLILGPDKQRLSKRTGATAVGEFQTRGFLPQAMFNFLTLLGWSPGSGDREIFLRDELVRVFSLDGIQTKSAVFDFAKLEWMNGEHLRLLGDADAVQYLADHADGQSLEMDYLAKLLPMIRTRIRLPKDLFEESPYFFSDPLSYDPAGVAKHFGDAAIVAQFRTYRAELSATAAFDPTALEAHLRSFCEAAGISAGKLIHPLRLALTGKTVSPGIFDVMDALGRETVLRRIDRALATIEA
ncbi:glutamate--tRNA ligase [candidate division KSB1 bacterium]|nr:glutamate--tRNA ligase [candidate division KSB1 bacterium]